MLHMVAGSSHLSTLAVRHSSPASLWGCPASLRAHIVSHGCPFWQQPLLQAMPGPPYAQIPDAPPSLTCTCSTNSNVQARSHPTTPADWALAEAPDPSITTLAQEALKQKLQSHHFSKNDKDISAWGKGAQMANLHSGPLET